jgi:hypothetical protein
MAGHAKKLPGCAKRDAARRQAERRKMGCVMTRTERMDRMVYRAPGEERSPNVVKCGLCADIPHARSPQRREYSSNGVTKPVGVAINGRWECLECHQPWAPEPPVPRPDAGVRSSGGMAARYGDVFGDEFLKKTTKRNQPK